MKRKETHLDTCPLVACWASQHPLYLIHLVHFIYLMWIIFQCLPLWPANEIKGITQIIYNMHSPCTQLHSMEPHSLLTLPNQQLELLHYPSTIYHLPWTHSTIPPTPSNPPTPPPFSPFFTYLVRPTPTYSKPYTPTNSPFPTYLAHLTPYHALHPLLAFSLSPTPTPFPNSSTSPLPLPPTSWCIIFPL
jgi:hypothetical protein